MTHIEQAKPIVIRLLNGQYYDLLCDISEFFPADLLFFLWGCFWRTELHFTSGLNFDGQEFNDYVKTLVIFGLTKPINYEKSSKNHKGFDKPQPKDCIITKSGWKVFKVWKDAGVVEQILSIEAEMESIKEEVTSIEPKIQGKKRIFNYYCRNYLYVQKSEPEPENVEKEEEEEGAAVNFQLNNEDILNNKRIEHILTEIRLRLNGHVENASLHPKTKSDLKNMFLTELERTRVGILDASELQKAVYEKFERLKERISRLEKKEKASNGYERPNPNKSEKNFHEVIREPFTQSGLSSTLQLVFTGAIVKWKQNGIIYLPSQFILTPSLIEDLHRDIIDEVKRAFSKKFLKSTFGWTEKKIAKFIRGDWGSTKLLEKFSKRFFGSNYFLHQRKIGSYTNPNSIKTAKFISQLVKKISILDEISKMDNYNSFLKKKKFKLFKEKISKFVRKIYGRQWIITFYNPNNLADGFDYLLDVLISLTGLTQGELSKKIYQNEYELGLFKDQLKSKLPVTAKRLKGFIIQLKKICKIKGTLFNEKGGIIEKFVSRFLHLFRGKSIDFNTFSNEIEQLNVKFFVSVARKIEKAIFGNVQDRLSHMVGSKNKYDLRIVHYLFAINSEKFYQGRDQEMQLASFFNLLSSIRDLTYEDFDSVFERILGIGIDKLSNGKFDALELRELKKELENFAWEEYIFKDQSEKIILKEKLGFQFWYILKKYFNEDLTKISKIPFILNKFLDDGYDKFGFSSHFFGFTYGNTKMHWESYKKFKSAVDNIEIDFTSEYMKDGNYYKYVGEFYEDYNLLQKILKDYKKKENILPPNPIELLGKSFLDPIIIRDEDGLYEMYRLMCKKFGLFGGKKGESNFKLYRENKEDIYKLFKYLYETRLRNGFSLNTFKLQHKLKRKESWINPSQFDRQLIVGHSNRERSEFANKMKILTEKIDNNVYEVIEKDNKIGIFTSEFNEDSPDILKFLGNLMHLLRKEDIENIEVGPDKKYNTYHEALISKIQKKFRDYIIALNVPVTYIHNPVGGEVLLLSGQLDILPLVDGRGLILDFKPKYYHQIPTDIKDIKIQFSKHLFQAIPQTAVYAMMLEKGVNIVNMKLLGCVFNRHAAYIFEPKNALNQITKTFDLKADAKWTNYGFGIP